MSRSGFFKPASLDLILKVNGKPTGDELRQAALAEEAAKLKAERDALPKYMNGRQRRALRARLKKLQSESAE